MEESIFNMLFSAMSFEGEHLGHNHMCTGMKLHMCIVSLLLGFRKAAPTAPGDCPTAS